MLFTQYLKKMEYYGILIAADPAYAAMYIATHPWNVNDDSTKTIWGRNFSFHTLVNIHEI